MRPDPVPREPVIWDSETKKILGNQAALWEQSLSSELARAPGLMVTLPSPQRWVERLGMRWSLADPGLGGFAFSKLCDFWQIPELS